MNILVTGGAGYVGSHAVKRLLAAGHSVVVLDNLVYGHRAATGSTRLVEGDLADRALVEGLLTENAIEAVMHFAAYAYVGESVTDPAKYYQNNIVGTLSLLDAMVACDVKKLVFSSTCATYGVPNTVPIPEDHPQAPINPYGFTKLVIERAMADYRRAYGLSYAALRYFNASGAAADGSIGEDHKPETHLIPLVLDVALGKREHITIFGEDYPTPDGTCIRDYIHVDDLGDAHVAAIQKLGNSADGPTELRVNVGTGQGASVRQVIAACELATGKTIACVAGPRREGDPAKLVADPRGAERLLGWRARHTDINEIVASAWRWHGTHPDGYADR
ncbi:UDP-glucose 4-epimerase GalE [Botrimarina hoheduenensis]|uniref:UDP-glucose 4-epimerase n=1 Tax=Botrimarina hoheduenensis TaxID=2528000 RepID=A0A5C5WAS0_9BACT|nr:UDP-glucose 4-epimerase GalE [Botrimarina hoheduenensis]TWT47780.1 UDP-glucose 4-epimerase [Botrimarina hoheduenensis]